MDHFSKVIDFISSWAKNVKDEIEKGGILPQHKSHLIRELEDFYLMLDVRLVDTQQIINEREVIKNLQKNLENIKETLK